MCYGISIFIYRLFSGRNCHVDGLCMAILLVFIQNPSVAVLERLKKDHLKTNAEFYDVEKGKKLKETAKLCLKPRFVLWTHRLLISCC